MIKERIMQAYQFAKEKHTGQKRRLTGLEYFTHPKGVARLVESHGGTEDMIIAALLHDTIEDTGTSYEEIKEKFGVNVANLVREVTDTKEERGTMKKQEYVIHKMGKMSPQALTIKLCDILHNLTFLHDDVKTKDDRAFVKWYAKLKNNALETIARDKLNVEQQKLYDKIVVRARQLGDEFKSEKDIKKE